MKYITFTGTGPYDQTRYVFENDNEFGVETKYVQECIFKKHIDEIEEAFIFRTNNPKCIENSENIKEILLNEKENLSVCFVEFDINDTFDELMKHVFELLNKNDVAMLDITCTFRSLPLSIIQILPYVQISKNAKIKHIYYGKYIKDSKDDTVIYDYIKYYESSKIISYLNQFISTIRVPSKKSIAIQNKEMTQLLNEMRKVQTSINVSNIIEEIKSIKNIKKLCFQLLETQPMYEYYLKQIIKDLEWVDEENLYICINNLSYYMFKHGYYQHAMTILDKNQTIIFNALLIGEKRLNLSKELKLEGLDKISKEVKLALENIGVKFQRKDIRRFEDIYELSNDTKNSLIKIFKNSSFKPMSKFRDLRNHVQHGETVTKRSTFNNDMKELEIEYLSYLKKLNSVASLPTIYLTTELDNKGLFAVDVFNTFVKEVDGHYEIC